MVFQMSRYQRTPSALSAPVAWIGVVVLSALLLASTGCTTTVVASSETVDGHAVCPVCEWRGDLACLDVIIADDTPRCDWNGRTYWFCSDDCLARFEKDSARFVH